MGVTKVTLTSLPVNSLHDNHNLLPGSVGARLAINACSPQHLLIKVLHTYVQGGEWVGGGGECESGGCEIEEKHQCEWRMYNECVSVCIVERGV